MIYFAQPTDGGPIKIGHSQDVPTRIAQLESHYGRPLALLATKPGDLAEERAIHERFDHLRLAGRRADGRRPEQFRPGPDLMAFIGSPLLVGANPDAVAAMDIGPGVLTTIINLKDSLEQRESLDAVSRKTMIPATRIVRAAIDMWMRKNGHPPFPGLEDES